MCLFYLYANEKIEIHICSNKHETGLVQELLLESFFNHLIFFSTFFKIKVKCFNI